MLTRLLLGMGPIWSTIGFCSKTTVIPHRKFSIPLPNFLICREVCTLSLICQFKIVLLQSVHLIGICAAQIHFWFLGVHIALVVWHSYSHIFVLRMWFFLLTGFLAFLTYFFLKLPFGTYMDTVHTVHTQHTCL